MAAKKSKKKTPKKAYKEPDTMEYCVDYDADYSYDCTSEGCSEEGICRCAKLTSASTKKVYYSSVYSAISGRSQITSIKDYCLDRWVRKSVRLEDFNIYSERGYYGDEARVAVEHDLLYKIKEFVALLNDRPARDCVEEILHLEYGYILPALENKSWKWADKVNINSIHAAHLDSPDPFKMARLDARTVEEYKTHDMLSCMCIKQGGVYRLIDGNHRLAAARSVLREKTKNYKRGRKPEVYMSVVYCSG